MATNIVVKILLLALLSLTNEVRPEDQNWDDENYCYSTDDLKPQYEMFSSKSAYEFIRAKPDADEFNVANCKPIQFWILCRHGTRLPGAKSMEDLANLETLRDEIINNHETKGELCEEDLEILKNWRWDYNITPDNDQFLVPQGYSDLKHLAERYQGRFPDLLSPQYSESDYHFRHTDTERTRRSAETFAETLFGHRISIPEPPEIDTLLRPFDFCPKWKNQEYKEEYNKFITSKLYQKMVRNISTRLGFEESLKQDVIDTIWDMCRFNKAWELEEASAWCAAFTVNDVKILEYQEDLKGFYGSGFGHEFNRRLGCVGVKDMLDSFSATVSGTAGPKVTAYFSHSTMLTLMQTTLGIGEDAEPLKAEDFYKNANRNYRLSQLDPFATNIAGVLYKCDSSDTHRHVVLLFQNEKLVHLKGCDNGLCSWEDLLRDYGSVVESCSLDECYES